MVSGKFLTRAENEIGISWLIRWLIVSVFFLIRVSVLFALYVPAKKAVTQHPIRIIMFRFLLQINEKSTVNEIEINIYKKCILKFHIMPVM